MNIQKLDPQMVRVNGRINHAKSAIENLYGVGDSFQSLGAVFSGYFCTLAERLSNKQFLEIPFDTIFAAGDAAEDSVRIIKDLIDVNVHGLCAIPQFFFGREFE